MGLLKNLEFLTDPHLSRPGNRDRCKFFYDFCLKNHHYIVHFKAKTAG